MQEQEYKSKPIYAEGKDLEAFSKSNGVDCATHKQCNFICELNAKYFTRENQKGQEIQTPYKTCFGVFYAGILLKFKDGSDDQVKIKIL